MFFIEESGLGLWRGTHTFFPFLFIGPPFGNERPFVTHYGSAVHRELLVSNELLVPKETKKELKGNKGTKILVREEAIQWG